MQFDSLADFMAMGGHGYYVWSVYAIGLAVLVINLMVPLLGERQLIAQAQKLRIRELKRAQAEAESGQQK
ncbi:MAG: heme exporter protein CcmD [Pseudomonadales bacterium]|nr:heme exporter protein CcmD [Pseudomonadales bacterium]